jgi:LysM repeat protein
MSYKPPYQVLGRKRRKGGGRNWGAILMWALSIAFTVSGLYLVGAWAFGGGIGSISLFASDTPTPTITLTPSNTPTITLTPSITPTPTTESTPTAEAPFLYTVALGDTLSDLADRFQVDFIIIMILNGLNNSSVLVPGTQLIIPNPDMEIPEPTPLPTGLPRGFEIEYLVLPGDNLAIIANKFLSTEEEIIDANDLEDPNSLFVGQLLIVPVNLVTPTPGPSPTPTSQSSPTPTP